MGTNLCGHELHAMDGLLGQQTASCNVWNSDFFFCQQMRWKPDCLLGESNNNAPA